jgi:hypothetical protein
MLDGATDERDYRRQTDVSWTSSWQRHGCLYYASTNGVFLRRVAVGPVDTGPPLGMACPPEARKYLWWSRARHSLGQ